MNIKIIEYAVGVFKNITDLCKKVMDAGDGEKYAKEINALNHGVDDTYTQMRKIIVESKEFSDDEKTKKLEELAQSEMKAKKICGDDIRENRSNVAKVSLEICKGFLTCGLSFTPALIKSIKNSLSDDSSISELETIVIDNNTNSDN